MYDIIIIGCGPAGMSAAIYGLRAGKKVLLLEKEAIGGKIASSPLVENYPGFKQISGMELSENLYDQVISLGGDFELEEVLKIKDGNIKTIITDDNTYQTKSIIIATGSSFRKLGLPNEEELIGNGISFCTVCDGAFYKDKDVAVIGGGNSALINAISLSEICRKVYIIQVLDSLTGEEALVKELSLKKNVEVILNSSVKEYVGIDELTGIIIDDGNKAYTLNVDGLFLSIGQIPETNLFKNMIDLNNSNYIVSNEKCTTNIDGIFVAGDCREKEFRQLTTAMNDGTIAALNAIKYIKNEN